MSLDLYFEEVKPTAVYERNITHNLNKMAKAIGVYEALWRPEECGIATAMELVPILDQGLRRLEELPPDEVERLSPKNGWGTKEDLRLFMHETLLAAKEFPDATVRASR